ncbi:MAG: hypothetical protein M3Q56_03730 [Bacteroidota bacterium]|nr:hypothetical protein [Bacteroidota bacterium]
MFGRYASPGFKQVGLWVVLLTAILVILYVSLEFKNQGHGSIALSVAAIPLALVLPYALWMAAAVIGGRNANWR